MAGGGRKAMGVFSVGILHKGTERSGKVRGKTQMAKCSYR